MTAVDPPKKILIVEDEEITLRIMQETLRNHGFEIDVSRNGPEAVDRLDSYSYDLIITDILMPIGTGFDVVQTVRDRNSHLPILVCSSYLTREVYSQLRPFGHIEFLSKPFPLQELVDTVKRLLGHGQGNGI